MTYYKHANDKNGAGSKITRRDFVNRSAGLGLIALTSGASWNVPAFAAQKRGGHLRAGISGGATSDTLDPTKFTGTFMISLSNSVRDHLIDIGLDNALEPALAESWESSADAKTWWFNIRKGVEFSNGKSLTLEDVVQSLQLHMGENSESAAKGLFEAVEDVTTDGKNVVVIKLAAGNADFPYLLTEQHLPIVPVMDGSPQRMSEIGTGLYIIENFEPGVRATLRRNPNAWQADLGFVDAATILAIADDTARQSALMAGQVDVIDRPGMKTINLLKQAPNIRIEAVTSNKHYTMPMRANGSPFDSLNVRTALKYAIDRDEFVKKILFGYGATGNDQPIGPGFRYHDADIPRHEFDPDKAKFYLKKEGLESLDIDYEVADAAFVGATDGAALFQSDAAKAGININVVRRPDDGYWSEVWNKKPFCASFWGSRPIEDMILSVAYLSTSPRNESRFENTKLDALIIGARAELDEQKRRQIYSDVQAIISGEGGTIVPAFAQDVMALSNRIGTVGSYGGGWEMDGGHFIKRWWMA